MCDTLNNARWHDRDVFCNQLRIEAIVLGEDTAGTGELTKFARIDVKARSRSTNSAHPVALLSTEKRCR